MESSETKEDLGGENQVTQMAEDGNNEAHNDLVNPNSDEDYRETDDEFDNDDETNKFLTLMHQAEKKNQKRLARRQKMFPTNKSNWRDVTLDDPDESTTDTEDEDDTSETRKFLNILQSAQRNNREKARKSRMVNVKWVNGKMVISNIPDTLKVTRVPPGDDAVRKHQEELARRRVEMRKMRSESTREGGQQLGGKRKFEERMTLTEAKLTDFQDTKDYVDFIQSKLQGVNIKIVK